MVFSSLIRYDVGTLSKKGLDMDINETTELILMVTNYGASEVLGAIRDIAVGMEDTQRSLMNTSQTAETQLRMWDEISRAVTPVVTKVHTIERKYKGMLESRKMIMDAIQNAANKQAQ